MMSLLPLSLMRARFLFGTIVLFSIANAALFPVVSLTLLHQGFDQYTIGAATSLYYLGSFTGVFTFGSVVTRFGQKAAIAIVALIAAGAAAGLNFVNEPVSWLILRFATGYALGGYYLVVDSWITSLAEKMTRGRLYATYEAIRLAAGAAGPLLLLLGAPHFTLLVISALFGLSFVPALLNATTSVGAGKRLDPRSLIGTVQCFPWALLIISCGGLWNASFYALGAVYAEEMGFPQSRVAFFVSIVLIAPVFTGVPVGAIADRFTRMRVAAAVSILAFSVALALVLSAATSQFLITTGGFVVGGCMVTMYALGLSRIVDALGERDAMHAATVGLAAYTLGSLLGPMVTARLMATLGPDGLYAAAGLFAFLAFSSAIADVGWSTCCVETPRSRRALT